LQEDFMAHRTAFIIDQLRRGFEGEAWHGPALFEILGDVDAAKASGRPVADAHSIWELVLHVAAWERAVLRRVRGEATTLEGEENFPSVLDSSESAWKKAVDELRQRHRELLDQISSMPDSRLSETVPGKDYDVHFMLHGAVQHAIYHAGQIAILKKARTESFH
jgi:uncharacterized damage-inducible protein DinB